ncbi:MAG TPA: IPT/TIG domain-containing protein [Tepidisphaeraceae bacterium]|nr:IPT/TIG domain-containing protein [Tepidisphaeraceae bacterium]
MSLKRAGRTVLGSFSLALLAAAATGGCGSSKQSISVVMPKDGAAFERGADVPARVTSGGKPFRATLIPRSGAAGGPSDVTNSFRANEAIFQDLLPGRYELAVELAARPKKGAAARDTAVFTIRQPRLSFNPGAPISIYAGTAASVKVGSSFAAQSPTDVSITPGDGSITMVPEGTSIPAGTTNSAPVRVSAVTAGTTDVTASADGYDSTKIRVNVRPVLSGATPSGTRAGSTITIEGAGFAPDSVARFGDREAKTTYASPTRLTAVIPAGLPTGTSWLTVQARGQASAPAPIEVVAPPQDGSQQFTLVRTGADDLQVYRYIPGEGFTETDDKTGLTAAGAGNVGVTYVGGMFIRADGAGVQRYNLFGGNAAPAGTQTGAGSRSLGVAAAGSTVLRATTNGVERYSVMGRQITPVPNGAARGTASAAGAAVDVKGYTAVRAHATGVDVYRVPPIGAPILVGSAAAATPNPRGGVGVCVAPGGARAVRSHANGIDVYAIAPDGKPTRLGTSNDGGPSDTTSAIAMNAAGTRAFRAHASGIEVYDITGTGTPKRLGGQNASVSTTGVGACVIGDYFFRATHDRLEAYNIKDLTSIPTPESTATSHSTSGVGLSGR